ncbi:hypothetical protein BXY66_0932 [Shimia isoporae]|uniref:Lipoprotein n=1 Tax=Shimia isoporae TaxID=647720 RepID=A0A4R1NMD4_9RHOB|nr:hypothetical protein [Shimia isoporae]TCL08891.1 hypothetical protein BXY66_0932 [Shimia isoporae]
MHTKKLALAFAAALGLAACGETIGEQAAIGAGAGALAAAVVDGNLVTGALVAGGANVAYCQLNPGKC